MAHHSLRLPPEAPATVTFTVEAIKLPPAAVQDSVGVVLGYQLEWSAMGGSMSGSSPLIFAEGDEIHFNYTAKILVPTSHLHHQQHPQRPRQQVPHLPPMLVISLNARMLDPSEGHAADTTNNVASYSVGSVALELTSHIPKPPSTVLKQRATLYLERCIYQDPPAMIRVMVAGTTEGEAAPLGYSRSDAAIHADGIDEVDISYDAGAAANVELRKRARATEGYSELQAAQHVPHLVGIDGVEMARRRVAQVRAKAREEAEKQQLQQLKKKPSAQSSVAGSRTATPNGGKKQVVSKPPVNYAQHPQLHTYDEPISPSNREVVASPTPHPHSHSPLYRPVPLTSPQPQDPSIYAGTRRPVTYEALRSPSLSEDILKALQKSNTQLKEDNDRLKQALEQRLQIEAAASSAITLSPSPRHATLQAAAPATTRNLLGSLSPLTIAVDKGTSPVMLSHYNATASRAPSITTTLNAVEELASVRMELRELQIKYNETNEALNQKQKEINDFQAAKKESTVTEQRLREEVAKLETALEVATAALHKSTGDEAEIKAYKERLLAAEKANRELSHKLHHSEAAASDAKALLEEVEAQRREEVSKRSEAEAKSVKVLSECAERVERYEASLRLGQQELQRMHAYGEELNKKCTELAALVSSQATMLEKRKEKIFELRGIIAANEKHLPSREDKGDHSAMLHEASSYHAAGFVPAALNYYNRNAIAVADVHASPLRELSRVLATQSAAAFPQRPPVSYQSSNAPSPNGTNPNHQRYPTVTSAAPHTNIMYSRPLTASTSPPQQRQRVETHDSVLASSPLQIREVGGRARNEMSIPRTPFEYPHPFAPKGQFIAVPIGGNTAGRKAPKDDPDL